MPSQATIRPRGAQAAGVGECWARRQALGVGAGAQAAGSRRGRHGLAGTERAGHAGSRQQARAARAC